MKSRLDTALDLLHTTSEAALATISVTMAGYPFASQVPFALDAKHYPVLLISSLAEHCKNLTVNPQASLLVSQTLADGEIARVTLIGEVHAFQPEAGFVARYLRYQPAAERFLQLGDFGFRCFEPRRIYVVGGFAQAGWLEGDRFAKLPQVSRATEQLIIDTAQATLPDNVQLLGIDAFGADVRAGGHRLRIAFPAGPVTQEALLPTVKQELARFIDQG